MSNQHPSSTLVWRGLNISIHYSERKWRRVRTVSQGEGPPRARSPAPAIITPKRRGWVFRASAIYLRAFYIHRLRNVARPWRGGRFPVHYAPLRPSCMECHSKLYVVHNKTPLRWKAQCTRYRAYPKWRYERARLGSVANVLLAQRGLIRRPNEMT